MAKITLSEIKHLVSKNREKGGTAPLLQPDPAPLDGTFLPRVSESSLAEGSLNPLQSPTDPPSTVANAHESGNTITSPKCFQSSRIPAVPPHKASITPEIEEEMRNVEGAFTIRELSEKFHIPAPALYRWARINRYKAKNGNRSSPIPDSTRQQIISSLDSMTTSDLAREYDIPYHILYHWMKKEGLSARNVSRFSPDIQKEIREKCGTFSLKTLALEYGLSQQAMRSRLRRIGCFSDGKGGFLVVDGQIGAEIEAFYRENGLEKTASAFHTTRTAIKSFLKYLEDSKGSDTL